MNILDSVTDIDEWLDRVIKKAYDQEEGTLDIYMIRSCVQEKFGGHKVDIQETTLIVQGILKQRLKLK